MGRKGSQKNQQKANESRVEEAQKRESSARAALEAYKKLPVTARPADYDEKVRRQQGILNRARTKQKKSDNHSRKGKGGGK